MQLVEIPLSLENHFFPNLPCQKQVLQFYFTDHMIQDVQLVLTGNIQTWIQIQDEKWFAFRKDICGPIFGGEFHAFRDYLITVGLNAQDITMLSILWEKEDLQLFLQKKDVQNILSNPTCYRLYSVMQQFTPKTQWGMTTTYFNEA